MVGKGGLADVPGLARKRIPADVVIRALPRVTERPVRPGKARGSRNPKAKMTEVSVAEARKRRRDGESIRSMALEYGVSRIALRNAVNGKTWAHVT